MPSRTSQPTLLKFLKFFNWAYTNGDKAAD